MQKKSGFLYPLLLLIRGIDESGNSPNYGYSPCSQAEITGTVGEQDDFEIFLYFNGTCCYGGVEKLVGKMTSKTELVGDLTPEKLTPGCYTPHANVIGYRR